MEPKEFRIGNFINTINRIGEVHLPDDTVFTIQKLGSKCELCRIDKKPWEEINLPEIAYYDLSPIPLTEEWLLKFGFENIDFGFFRKYTSEKYYILTHPKQGYSEICINSICGGQSSTKYVHQLQNLYFALTGEELKTILT